MTGMELGATLGTQSFEAKWYLSWDLKNEETLVEWGIFSQAEERAVQNPQGKNEPGVFQQEKMGIAREAEAVRKRVSG